MGLLKPSKGNLIVDGQNIYDPQKPEILFSWRKAIAHVPQNIYLSDSSIAENIAFGIPKEKISMKRVKECAKSAQIEKFINSLEKGYSTFVGERGIKLSGGQRQRIGIARALYKRSSILIFDEATSALDNETEVATIDGLKNLGDHLTTIIIAHRLSTLKYCDKIITLDKGKVKSLENSKDFL